MRVTFADPVFSTIEEVSYIVSRTSRLQSSINENKRLLNHYLWPTWIILKALTISGAIFAGVNVDNNGEFYVGLGITLVSLFISVKGVTPMIITLRRENKVLQGRIRALSPSISPDENA
jgi:hypothetical protein